MAAPTYRSVATAAEFGGDTSLVITKPAGTVNGDLMVACVWAPDGFYANAGSLTPPAGWTTVTELLSGNAPIIGIYYKVASSEGTDYTWTVNDGSNRNGAIVTVQTGTYDTTTPIGTTDGVDWSRALANASVVLGAPTITPAVNECLGIAFFFAVGDGNTWTAPSTWTERADYTDSFTGGCVDTKALTTSATGTVTPGVANTLWGGEGAAMVAVRPVSGPATIEATASGAFGGLSSTVVAFVTVVATAAASWGSLDATATASVEGGDIEATAEGAWGGLGAIATAFVTVQAAALGAFGGLVGTATASNLTPGSYFWEPFTQADGDPVGWALSANELQVVSNKLETMSFTTYEQAAISIGFTLPGDWEIIYDGTAPLISGNGGIHVGVFDGFVSGNGYSAFIGNASHIYRWSGGVQTFITNVGRPGEGGAGVLQNIVRLTYEAATNTLRIYLDGVEIANVVDSTHDPATWAAPTCAISMGNVNSPTQKTVLDSILVARGIGNTYPPSVTTVEATAAGDWGALTGTAVATTTIGDELGLQWAVKQAVADNNSLVWNTKAVIADNNDLRWNIRALLAENNDLRWAIKTLIGENNDLRWAIKAALGDNNSLRWDVKALFGENSDLRWAVKDLIGDNADLRWDIKSTLGENLELMWDVLQSAVFGESLDLRWAVKQAFGDDNDLRWNVRSAFNDSLDTRWAIRSTLGDQSSLQWSVRNLLSDNIDLQWAVHFALGDTVDLQWGVRTTLLENLSIIWGIKTLIGDTNSLVWNIKAHTGDQLELVWDILSGVVISDTLSLRWDIRSLLQDNNDLRWGIRTTVNDNASLRWNIRSLIGENIDLRWDVLEALVIGENLDLRWAIKSSIGDDLDARWSIRTLLYETLGIDWSVRSIATEQIDLLWNVKAAVGDQLSIIWTIFGSGELTPLVIILSDYSLVIVLSDSLKPPLVLLSDT